MSCRKRRISQTSFATSSKTSIGTESTISSVVDPLDVECKLLKETCQMYGTSISSLDDDSSTFVDSDSDDDLNEICLDGDVDCLRQIFASTNDGVLIAQASDVQLDAEDARALLNLNKAYQKVIERKIQVLKAKINYLQSKKKELRKQSATSKEHSRKPYILSQKDCNPYFQDSLRRGPNLSDYANLAMEQCIKLNTRRNFRPFLMENANAFSSSVAEDIRSQLLKIPEKNLERMRMDEDRDDVEYSETLEMIKEINEMAEEELLKRDDLYNSVDWSRLSAKNQWAPTATACCSLWHNLLKPSINKSKWTMEETKHLLQICEHIFDWEEVAEVLGTGRSPYMCLKRFMEKEPMRDRPFLSKPEQKELLQIINANRVGHHVSWSCVSYCFQKRNREVLISINISIEEGVKRTRWTKTETELLTNAVRDFGFTYINWLEISRHIPGRSPTMCARKYATVCNRQLRERGLLENIAQLYDQIKTDGGTSNLDSNIVFSSQLWCILNACSLNEVIYKWIRAQRDSIRTFLLTYYKNPDFHGPTLTPKGNLIYAQPIVKMRANEMAILSTQKAKESIEKLLEYKDKGIRPVLPGLANLARIIDEEANADAVFEKIQDYTTRTESIARQRNLWQLQHFQYTAKYRKDRIEYLHCMSGFCYVRRNAQVGAEVSDLIDDVLTALMIFKDLQHCEEHMAQSLERVSNMLGLMQDLLLTGILPFSSNIRLADLNKVLIDSIRGNCEVIQNPIVLVAAYVWSTCESAKCCANSHKMTARYVHIDCRDWPSFKRSFFEDKDCVVCTKFGALMHRYLPPFLLNHARLINDHLAEGNKDKVEFVGTSIRQHMVQMFCKIALMPPTHRMQVKNSQTTRDIRRVTSEVVLDIVHKVVVETEGGPHRRKVVRRRKVPRRYKQCVSHKFNVSLPKHTSMVDRRCDSQAGSELIDRVTKIMNEDKRYPKWIRRQTRLIYSIISGIVIRVEKVIGLTGLKRYHKKDNPPTLRRSGRLAPAEKSRPWVKISEGRDVLSTYKPQRKQKNRNLTGKKLGRPSKGDRIRKLEAKKRADNQIFINSDFACDLFQTERFAHCAKLLSINVPALLNTSSLFSRHYRQANNALMNRMAHCVKSQLSIGPLPTEVEHQLSCAFERCLYTITKKEFLDQMVHQYLSTVSSFDSFAEPSAGSRKRKAGSNNINIKSTRRQLKQKVQLAKANFVSPYWHSALSRNIDVDSYSILRKRLRTMLYPALKKLITNQTDPESIQRTEMLNNAALSVKAALQSYNDLMVNENSVLEGN